jgi:exopolysaccharide production protein ExoQ
MADSIYRLEQARPARAPLRSGALGPRGLPASANYCHLFSVDWWLICLAIFAITFSLGGDVSVLVYLGACGWVARRHLGQVGRTLARCWPLLLMPAVGMLSTIWSDQPSVSLKQSAELMATMVFAIAVCARVRARELTAAALFASLLLCLLSLAYQRDGLRSYAFIGLMGSKNQMAFVAEVLFLSGLAAGLDGGNSRRLRMFAAAGAAVGLLGVVLAQSAGIWVTSAVAGVALVGFTYFSRISLGVRIACVVLGILVVSPLAFAYQDVQQSAQRFQTDTLHKDATLTGRTSLWTAAQSVIAERPVLGHGFNAFWLQGNLDAEALWRTHGIASRGGFNFHNQFLDTEVDLGEVGLVALAISLVYVAFGALWRAVTAPSASAAFMSAVLVALYLRLPVESTLLGAWSSATFLWVAIGVSAFAAPRRLSSATPRASATERSAWRVSHDRLRASAGAQRVPGGAS